MEFLFIPVIKGKLGQSFKKPCRTEIDNGIPRFQQFLRNTSGEK